MNSCVGSRVCLRTPSGPFADSRKEESGHGGHSMRKPACSMHSNIVWNSQYYATICSFSCGTVDECNHNRSKAENRRRCACGAPSLSRGTVEDEAAESLIFFSVSRHCDFSFSLSPMKPYNIYTMKTQTCGTTIWSIFLNYTYLRMSSGFAIVVLSDIRKHRFRKVAEGLAVLSCSFNW